MIIYQEDRYRYEVFSHEVLEWRFVWLLCSECFVHSSWNGMIVFFFLRTRGWVYQEFEIWSLRIIS